jgi:hypothetical protein
MKQLNTSRTFFSENGQNVIEDQINLVRLFTNIVTEEDVHILEKAVSKEEIIEVLRGFARDKSPRPDGWTVEFFFKFFDLVGQDLLEMVEESRVKW